jgi:inhibitor of KinA sporulation pathway (predicted exonuclease)
MEKVQLVIDVEATCWESYKTPDLNEIIDIGVVLCDSDFNFIDDWSSFVKPKTNKKLSSFCKKLTSIKQEWIDSAESLESVLVDLKKWLEEKHKIDHSSIRWNTWDISDIKFIENDCKRNDLLIPFGSHYDLQKIYFEKRGISSCSLKNAAQIEGIENKGVWHRGVSDAFITMMIAKTICYSEP